MPNLTSLEHLSLPDCSNMHTVYFCVFLCVCESLCVCIWVSNTCFGLAPSAAARLAEFGSRLCHFAQINLMSQFTVSNE